MSMIHFPVPFQHKHAPIRNVADVFAEHLTFGQRTADRVAALMGSWTFIIVQSLLLLLWIALNVTAYIAHWDPYPFILMNLVLSLQAAYTAPMILMSQNRQAAHDRLEAHNDFLVNQKAEEEVRVVLEHLDAQNVALSEIHATLLALQQSVVQERKNP